MRRNTTIRTDDRGQAYTLEAIIAALLLVSSLVFALQVTAVTPLSASTSNQHIENQQRSTAAGALAAADESGALKDAVLYWNESGETFWNPGDDYDRMQRGAYTNEYPPNEFGAILERSFSGRGLAVNVDVRYQDGEHSWSSQRMVYRGSPSDNAVTATRTVTLYDDDTLTQPEDTDNPERQPTVSTGEELDDIETFYAGDESEQSGVYNVVQVEVTVWRM